MSLATETAAGRGSAAIPTDCHGQNFWRIDPAVQDLLALSLGRAELAHFRPHFDRLGELAGGRLDELAASAERHPPVLRPRDRFGRDEDSIDYHPAYREMERIGFEDFQFHTMCHQPNAFGTGAPAPQALKYAFQYLFIQSECGMMCPLSITDATNFVISAATTAGSNQTYVYGLVPQANSLAGFTADQMASIGAGSGRAAIGSE